MFILSTLLPEPNLIQEIQKMYPSDQFSFYKSMDEAKKDLDKAEVLITYGEDLTPGLIEQAKRLKWIMVMSAGLELMPFKAIMQKGVLVTNARGIHKIPMAEYTISMMLHIAKRNKQLLTQQQDRNWNRLGIIPVDELHGKTVGILGVGAIGGEIARLAKAFNMKVIGLNRSGKDHEYVDQMYKYEELNTICSTADYLVSVLPSTNETKYLLNESHFNVMKNELVFINIGRGDLVKEEVLLHALNTNKISHAILDVFEQEPLPKDHPFWAHEKITVTPHISSKTDNYLPRSFEIFNRNFTILKQGGTEFINKIDPERGY
ncbi:D-2-hydroxyacid dehydrogenase [Fredinandcohnia sp. 179-A 10B2 NHS]|uniref:D-2-hydroxyacid dehydrogenase n=1 Tax=Fredinandcohnia sp. 179-A 10B2 NHS TaxID=3235176 RepID=UPI0039A38E7E